MRKSQYVTILLGGAAALAALSVLNTNSTNNVTEPAADDGTLYGDAAACAKDVDAGTCAAAFDAAKEEHVKQAPKFATAAECEAAGFAQCEPAPVQSTQAGSSTGMFMPMMMGFMMGRMMGGGGLGGFGMPPRAGVPGAPNPVATARPVLADRNGYLYANGANVGRVAPGTTSIGSSAVPMRTASRGGFGASAGRFSGGGS